MGSVVDRCRWTSSNEILVRVFVRERSNRSNWSNWRDEWSRPCTALDNFSRTRIEEIRTTNEYVSIFFTGRRETRSFGTGDRWDALDSIPVEWHIQISSTEQVTRVATTRLTLDWTLWNHFSLWDLSLVVTKLEWTKTSQRNYKVLFACSNCSTIQLSTYTSSLSPRVVYVFQTLNRAI